MADALLERIQLKPDYHVSWLLAEFKEMSPQVATMLGNLRSLE